MKSLKTRCFTPGQVAQLEMCLTTDAHLTADQGVESSIPAQSHTFLELGHEIISIVILLLSTDSFKKGCCQLRAKVCGHNTGQLLKLAQEKVWLGELTLHHMTIAVDWDVEQQNKLMLHMLAYTIRLSSVSIFS